VVEHAYLHPDRNSVLRVLALESLEGVGRVSARRLIEQFESVDDMKRLPREQVLNKMKGIPGAAKLVSKLLDDAQMEALNSDVSRKLDVWSERHVQVLTFEDSASWPVSLERLPNPHRPNALFAYGQLSQLAEPRAALIGPPQLTEASFERAQKLVDLLLKGGAALAQGLSTGFDVVSIKLGLESGIPILAVPPCGLGRIERPMRPYAGQVVKSGGLMVSSLPMDHGPFDHDRKEGSLIQASLARAVVFIDPQPEGFEWAALDWAIAAGMPVFLIGEADVPDRVHRIREAIDMEWVLAAVRHVRA
jgi:predicted Rossmann fold nucleotide-binding protein DprA/Smf involved in DNA uptake